MNGSCEEVQRAIPWLLDDELEAVQTLELEAHIDDCVACRSVLEAEGSLRQTLRRAGASVTAPSSLRRRVRNAIDGEKRRDSWVGQWMPAAAAAAILLSFIWRGDSAGWESEIDEVTRRHARNLPMDVVAADVLKVQSYLNDKLPFAVRVPDLRLKSAKADTPASQPTAEPARGSMAEARPASLSSARRKTPETPVAFRMLGGRVTHVRNHDAAYVRYETASGRVSIFVYEDPDFQIVEGTPWYSIRNRRVSLKRVRGYTVARWRASGLVYSVVTDLPENETTTVLYSIVR
ncbi:MAG: zf-HC2 domain-containing protein [Myxococcota bacterium]